MFSYDTLFCLLLNSSNSESQFLDNDAYLTLCTSCSRYKRKRRKKTQSKRTQMIYLTGAIAFVNSIHMTHIRSKHWRCTKVHTEARNAFLISPELLINEEEHTHTHTISTELQYFHSTVKIFKTHKRLKERFLIRRNRTKRANFRGKPLFQATYNNTTENS